MTKSDFIYALKTCGCLYHNEQIYYEENELIRMLEDLEMLEEEKSLKDMTNLEHAIKHIKTRADAWAVKEVTEALQSISERMDKALSQEPCTDAVSREAVIDAIYKYDFKYPKYMERFVNELREAIKADLIDDVKELPSVNPQPCDDAISREAVLDTTICEGISCDECSFNEIDGESGCLLHARIDELPSVTQKSETVTEFADRCRECGAKYGKLLEQKSEKWIDGVHAMGYREGYKDAQKQKSGKWIPVSERLPEENKQVLIQYRTRYRDDVNLFDVTSRADYNYWQGIGREIDVIAWMPLPKPYEPQESEEQTEVSIWN